MDQLLPSMVWTHKSDIGCQSSTATFTRRAWEYSRTQLRLRLLREGHLCFGKGHARSRNDGDRPSRASVLLPLPDPQSGNHISAPTCGGICRRSLDCALDVMVSRPSRNGAPQRRSAPLRAAIFLASHSPDARRGPSAFSTTGLDEVWAMDIVQAMRVFARVVETKSFTRASETLDLPRGRVTVIVQNLEAHLKTRLLQRTTRSLNLTADGAAYYERCVRVLADIDDIESSFLGKKQSPRGKLRVDMPGALGRLIVMPALADFHERYPEIDLMLGLGDKPLDLVQEGVDCVVRIGTLQDSSLVARRVGIYQAVTVASSAYLHKAGTPRTLDELANHQAVNYYWGRTGRIMPLTFDVDGKAVEVKMRGSIAVNDAEAYLGSALNGLGIVQGARFMALPYLESGTLVEILSQWKPPPLPISAVYPHNRHLSATVRTFVDWIAELFRNSALLTSTPDADARCRPTSIDTQDADLIELADDEERPTA